MSKHIYLANTGLCIILRTFSKSSLHLKKAVATNVLKKYNTENKQLFGPLLETQAQRKKRLKSNTSTDILVAKESSQIPQSKISLNLVSHCDELHCSEVKENVMLSVDQSKGDDQSIPNVDKSFFETNYSNMTLEELINLKFPLENPARTSVGSQCTSPPVPRIETKSDVYFPSVTSILKATVPETSRIALEKWAKKKIQELGHEGFLELQERTLRKGREFHSAIHHMLTEKESPLDVSEDIQNCMKSAAGVLERISNVHALEAEVRHPVLQYRGFADCICDIGNSSNVIIEWKKADRKKISIEHTYDAPIQAAGYMGALNFDDKFSYQVKKALIIVVYDTGYPANVFEVTRNHWTQWFQRYSEFVRMNLRQTDSVLRQFQDKRV